MKAYVLVTTKPGTSEEFVKQIKSVSGVVEAHSVYGRYDAIVEVEAPTLEEIAKIVYNIIEKSPNVVHTETAITFS